MDFRGKGRVCFCDLAHGRPNDLMIESLEGLGCVEISIFKCQLALRKFDGGEEVPLPSIRAASQTGLCSKLQSLSPDQLLVTLALALWGWMVCFPRQFLRGSFGNISALLYSGFLCTF